MHVASKFVMCVCAVCVCMYVCVCVCVCDFLEYFRMHGAEVSHFHLL